MLDLTWWQMFAIVVSAVISIIVGRLAGGAAHRALYRRVLLARTRMDDRYILRLDGAFEIAGIVLVWQALVSMISMSPGALVFCRNVGHIVLLLAIGLAAMRTVDTAIEQLALRATHPRLAGSLLPLARRVAKIVLGTMVGVMIIGRLGYSTGPLLVLLAIVGGCIALAAHRPLENIVAAYAIAGDHGIHEGDVVVLENGTRGTIENIGLYSTRLRTPSSLVIVPNRRLADAQIERSVQRPQIRPLGVVPAASGE